MISYKVFYHIGCSTSVCDLQMCFSGIILGAFQSHLGPPANIDSSCLSIAGISSVVPLMIAPKHTYLQSTTDVCLALDVASLIPHLRVWSAAGLDKCGQREAYSE